MFETARVTKLVAASSKSFRDTERYRSSRRLVMDRRVNLNRRSEGMTTLEYTGSAAQQIRQSSQMSYVCETFDCVEIVNAAVGQKALDLH